MDEELRDACGDGDLPVVKRLLARGGDVNAKFSDTPLVAASRQGHVKVVQFLLDNNAKIDDKGSDG